jgi:hypothetical protein
VVNCRGNEARLLDIKFLKIQIGRGTASPKIDPFSQSDSFHDKENIFAIRLIAMVIILYPDKPHYNGYNPTRIQREYGWVADVTLEESKSAE